MAAVDGQAYPQLRCSLAPSVSVYQFCLLIYKTNINLFTARHSLTFLKFSTAAIMANLSGHQLRIKHTLVEIENLHN